MQRINVEDGLRIVSAAGGCSCSSSNQVVRQDSLVRSVEIVEKEDVESAMYQGKAPEIQPAMTLPLST